MWYWLTVALGGLLWLFYTALGLNYNTANAIIHDQKRVQCLSKVSWQQGQSATYTRNLPNAISNWISCSNKDDGTVLETMRQLVFLTSVMQLWRHHCRDYCLFRQRSINLHYYIIISMCVSWSHANHIAAITSKPPRQSTKNCLLGLFFRYSSIQISLWLLCYVLW